MAVSSVWTVVTAPDEQGPWLPVGQPPILGSEQIQAALAVNYVHPVANATSGHILNPT
jgi:hypothetical protein